MAPFLFLAFILIPVIEIAVFIQLGGQIGLWNTIGLIVLTAFLGTALLRAQGIGALRRAQESMARNVFPTDELFDGICLLIAGVLLLTPGFVTDAIGFSLFIPPFRRFIGAALWRALARRADMHVHMPDGGETSGAPGTIDGEYRDVTGSDGSMGGGNRELPDDRDKR